MLLNGLRLEPKVKCVCSLRVQTRPSLRPARASSASAASNSARRVALALEARSSAGALIETSTSTSNRSKWVRHQ
eukprot:scaffold1728_cov53-Phaeocystis_antarctica.AAC.3